MMIQHYKSANTVKKEQTKYLKKDDDVTVHDVIYNKVSQKKITLKFVKD